MASLPNLPFWSYPAMFGTGLVAGFVDSIAGGGGLITLPVLLSFGFPPKLALGTNKLQATCGSGSAAFHFAQSKAVSLRECGWGLVFTGVGAALGTVLVQQLNPNFLKQFIPIILVALGLYLVFRPRFGESDVQPRVGRGVFYAATGLGLGFYDGFLGPGTGSFWCMAFMVGLGFNMTKATAYTKAMNFASNLVSLVFFAIGGQVLLAAGVTMGLGQLIGAKVGSGMVLARGTQFIRPIFITMVLAITLKLLWDSWR
ncbi:MAG TPA: TSUP family transporter [Verrucomicrobiae bacterium]|nr:TSUP family transporter [Verrucomicrobiae bacterium]